MRIEILRSVMISGESALAGSLLEVSDADAGLLIGMNKARKAIDPEPVPETPKRGRKTTTTAPEEA